LWSFHLIAEVNGLNQQEKGIQLSANNISLPKSWLSFKERKEFLDKIIEFLKLDLVLIDQSSSF